MAVIRKSQPKNKSSTAIKSTQKIQQAKKETVTTTKRIKPPKTEKEKLLTKEINKLKSIFKDIDKETMSFILPLIENAAYMKVTLKELQKEIDINGAVETYQNGKNQTGQKPSSASTVYNTMIKNYINCMTKLEAYMPTIEDEDDGLAEFL